MSRTKKGSKGCGFEYWGRQQVGLDRDKCFDNLRDPGKENKSLLHKVDRRKTKQDLDIEAKERYNGEDC
jgi:hypothetical protein